MSNIPIRKDLFDTDSDADSKVPAVPKILKSIGSPTSVARAFCNRSLSLGRSARSELSECDNDLVEAIETVSDDELRGVHTWRQRFLLSTIREDRIEYKGTRRAHSVNGKGDGGNGYLFLVPFY